MLRLPSPGLACLHACGPQLPSRGCSAAVGRVFSRARLHAGLWNGVPVAIKVVPSYKIGKIETAMQEAVLSSNISHPNVVRLLSGIPTTHRCRVRVRLG